MGAVPPGSGPAPGETIGRVRSPADTASAGKAQFNALPDDFLDP